VTLVKPAPTTGLRSERDGDKGAAGIVLSAQTPAHRLFTGATENTEADFARLQSWPQQLMKWCSWKGAGFHNQDQQWLGKPRENSISSDELTLRMGS